MAEFVRQRQLSTDSVEKVGQVDLPLDFEQRRCA
jgi:hypothetical protein